MVGNVMGPFCLLRDDVPRRTYGPGVRRGDGGRPWSRVLRSTNDHADVTCLRASVAVDGDAAGPGGWSRRGSVAGAPLRAGTIRGLMPPDRRSARRLPLSYRRAFVQRHTKLQEVEGVPGVRLHLGGALEPVWHAVEEALGISEARFLLGVRVGGRTRARGLAPGESGRGRRAISPRLCDRRRARCDRRGAGGCGPRESCRHRSVRGGGRGPKRTCQPCPRHLRDPGPSRRAAARRGRAARRRHLV